MIEMLEEMVTKGKEERGVEEENPEGIFWSCEHMEQDMAIGGIQLAPDRALAIRGEHHRPPRRFRPVSFVSDQESSDRENKSAPCG